MKITEFESLYSKEALGVIDAREWMVAIRDGKYRTLVERIRECLRNGRKDEARNLKMKLHAVVFAGDCRKGRFFAKTIDRTGWAMFDIDDIEPEIVATVRKLLEECAWVVMVHVTSSGRGLRIVVNIGMVHIDVYRDAYELVAKRLRTVTGVELDMQCKDFARTSLASYDPDIYFNPDASVFDYDADANPLRYVPVCGPDCSEDFRIPETMPGVKSSESAEPVARQQTSARCVDVRSVIERFFSTNVYSEGSRHSALLRLGGYLRWRGIESWQLDDAVAVVCSRAVEPGMPEKEVRNAVVWGYNHGSEGGNVVSAKVQKGQFKPMYPPAPDKVAENPDCQTGSANEEDEEDVINTHCVPFPDEIFECLPVPLKELLVVAKDKRERDVILLSCITIMSGLFPALRTIYSNQKYSAHLYSCFLANAGSGKGVAMYSTILGKPVHAELEKIYRIEKKEYEKKLMEWEVELRSAFRDKRLPDMELKPEEPTRQMFYLQTNTSKSQMMHDMASSNGDGNVMFTSEIDALAESLKTDYGKHAAELRMFFHHEGVGQRFKTDKEPIEIESPRLALMMSGTPEQLVRFINTIEDGMYSRFLFYMMSPANKWKSQSPLDGNGGIDVGKLFGGLAEKLKANFFDTRGKEVMINFTREQWNRHEKAFSMELGMVVAEGNPNTAAIVHRAGLIVLRIAMVLCGIRIMEAGWQIADYTCSDEDFDSALEIVLTSMKHSANITTMINETVHRKRITNFYKLLPVLKKMKNNFKYSDFKNEVISTGNNDTAAKRALRKYLESGLISRTSDGYKKTSLLKNGYKEKK